MTNLYETPSLTNRHAHESGTMKDYHFVEEKRLSLSSTDLATPIRKVRGQLLIGCLSKSILKASILISATAAVYASTIAGAIFIQTIPLALVSSLLNGVSIGALFVLAHDAAHSSLTPVASLNKILGRILFLPSLQPVTSWEHTHNGLHHAWTNVRGKETSYVPFQSRNLTRFRDTVSFLSACIERSLASVSFT
jgi:fatty acid desaturase